MLEWRLLHNKEQPVEAGNPEIKEITQLLERWRLGDDTAIDELTPLIYSELYARALYYLGKERANHTLSTTALVNEVFIRVIGERDREWHNRSHFYAIAAKIMKNLLIQYAQARSAQKRGGGHLILTFEHIEGMGDSQSEGLVALNDCLERLEKLDKRKAWVVEMYYFGGMTIDEIGDVLHISAATVKRELKFSRAWLRKCMKRHMP